MLGHVGLGLDLGAGLLFSGCCLLSPRTASASSTEQVAATVWPSATDLGLSLCSGVSLGDCEGLGGHSATRRLRFLLCKSGVLTATSRG